MALIVADRVKQESTTTGTGTFTLAGSVDGFQNFSDVCSTNDTMYYVIQEKIGTDFEVGHGTFNSSGQLERTNILQSSNNDNAVNFGAGTKDVFITYPADKAVFQNYDGSITIPSTIDGRDLANDGSKLDGIEASATADQTAAEIRTLVESATDSNVFTDADHTKLNGIEASATADQTDAEIRAAVEAATDSNVFTDADHTKLNGIETSADVTDATNVDAAGAIMNSDVATKGQIIVGDGAGDPTILSVGTDGHYLKADSSAGSGVAWASIPAGVGGTNGVDFNDDVKARFGTGNDLEIFHESSSGHSKMKDGSGVFKILGDSVRIRSADDSKASANFNAAGAIEFHHNNVKKAETSQYGFDLPNDNIELRLGASQDLKIWHDGTNSNILNNTGALKFRCDSYTIRSNDDSKNAIVIDPSGSTDLYFNGSHTTEMNGSSFRIKAAKALELDAGTWTGETNGKIQRHSNHLYFQTVDAGSFIFRNTSGSDKVEIVASNGNIIAQGNVTAYSSKKLKSNIETIDNALDKVSQMRGVTFTKDNEKGSGVIAEELEQVAPELVVDGEYKSVAYGNIVGYLIEAIKDLKTEIETLKKKKCECCE